MKIICTIKSKEKTGEFFAFLRNLTLINNDFGLKYEYKQRVRGMEVCP
jgi:hypothetical protein